MATLRAAASASAFETSLVSSLDSLHLLPKPDMTMRKGPQTLQSSPELAMTLMLRHGLQNAQSARSGLLLWSEPSMAAAGGGAAGVPAAAGVLWHVAAFAEAVGRIAPAQLMAAAREPLLAWNKLSPEVRHAACEVLLKRHVSCNQSYCRMMQADDMGTWTNL